MCFTFFLVSLSINHLRTQFSEGACCVFVAILNVGSCALCAKSICVNVENLSLIYKLRNVAACC